MLGDRWANGRCGGADCNGDGVSVLTNGYYYENARANKYINK